MSAVGPGFQPAAGLLPGVPRQPEERRLKSRRQAEKPRPTWAFAIALAILAALAPALRGQVNTGVLRGTVVDAQARPVGGASVVVQGGPAAFAAEATTRSDGEFEIALPYGRHGRPRKVRTSSDAPAISQSAKINPYGCSRGVDGAAM